MSGHDPRVLKHIEALKEVDTDIERFGEVLDAIRTDPNLPTVGRTAILRTVAQNQAIAWLAAVSGLTPINPEES